jgi:hypothetical protein
MFRLNRNRLTQESHHLEIMFRFNRNRRTQAGRTLERHNLVRN